jgi:hypothetical protein
VGDLESNRHIIAPFGESATEQGTGFEVAVNMLL